MDLERRSVDTTHLKFSLVNINRLALFHQQHVVVLHDWGPLVALQVNLDMDPCRYGQTFRLHRQVERVCHVTAVIVTIGDEAALEIVQCERHRFRLFLIKTSVFRGLFETEEHLRIIPDVQV